MITLPAKITTALAANSYKVGYYIEVESSSSSTYKNWGLSSGTFKWATFESTINNITWVLAKEKPVSNFAWSVDISEGGNVAQKNQVTITINNVEDSSGKTFVEYLEDNSIYIINRSVTIYKFVWTGSDPTSTSDGIQFFTGIVKEERVSEDRTKCYIICEDDSDTRHNVIADGVIDTNVSGWSSYVIPEDSKEQTMPVAFGDLTRLDIEYGPLCPAKGILVDLMQKKSGASTGQKVISSDPAYNYKEITDGYIWIEGVGKFIKLPTETSSPDLREWAAMTNEGGIIFSENSGGESFPKYACAGGVYLVMYVELATEALDNPTYSGDANDSEKCIDRDLTSKGYISSFAGNAIKWFIFNLPQYGFSTEAKAQKVYFLGKVNTGGSSIPSSGQVHACFANSDYFPSMGYGYEVVILNTSDNSFDNLDTMADDEFDKEIPIYSAGAFDFRNLNTLFMHPDGDRGRYFGVASYCDYPDTMPQVDLYEVKFRIEFTQNMETSEFYFTLKGLKDDGSGTYTGTASALIEKPDQVIAAIEGEILGVASGNIGIGTTSVRNSWSIAKQLIEPVNSIDVIKNICYQTGMIYFIDHESKSQVKTLEKTSASVNTWTIADVRPRTGNKFKGFYFRKWKTPIEEIYNGYIVKYCYNQAKDRYMKIAYCKNTGTIASPTISDNMSLSSGVKTLCSNSITNYNCYRVLEVECDWITEDATAKAFLEWAIIFFCQRVWHIEFETPNLNRMAYELGDEFIYNDDIFSSERFFPYKIEHITTNDPGKTAPTTWKDCA